MSKFGNQQEIFSFDYHVYDKQRFDLFNRCIDIGKKNNLKCVIGLPSIRSINELGETTVFIWQFDLLPNLPALLEIDNTLTNTGRIIYIITDNMGNFPELNSVKFFSRPEILGVYLAVDDLSTLTYNPQKLFNCFMQRIESTRQSWFYFLHIHNLIDKGYVSFLLKQLPGYSNLTGKELFDYIHHNYNLNSLPQFDLAYTYWKDKIPFTNFEEKLNLLPIIQDSKYSVILETYAVEDDHLFTVFNEKAIRALQYPSIPLLFVQRGGIGLLKSLGFEFTDYLDQVDNSTWQERQQAILKILIDNPIAFDKNILYNQIEHNRNLVSAFHKKLHNNEFFESIFDEILAN